MRNFKKNGLTVSDRGNENIGEIKLCEKKRIKRKFPKEKTTGQKFNYQQRIT